MCARMWYVGTRGLGACGFGLGCLTLFFDAFLIFRTTVRAVFGNSVLRGLSENCSLSENCNLHAWPITDVVLQSLKEITHAGFGDRLTEYTDRANITPA